MAFSYKRPGTILAGLTSVPMVLAIGPAHAEATPQVRAGTELEEIVVTASKREEKLQSVPQTITAFTDQSIKDVGAQDFSGLINSMAGVELRSVQSGQGGVTIRGVAEMNISNLFGGTGSATGLYLDEIPLTSAGFFPDVSSFDMARVEVLKGPQGTLFGEGSLAGTVRLVSNQPDAAKFGAAADLTYSSTDSGGDNQIYNGMINVPLVSDKLALRVVGFHKDLAGFIDTRDASTGHITKDTNDDQSEGGRVALLFTPSDRLSVSLSALISNADRGARNRATEDYVGTLSVPEKTQDDIRAYNGTLRFGFDAADLVVTTSYFTRDVDSIIDQGGLVPTVNFVFGLFGIDFPVTGVFINQQVSTDTLAAEARLVSNGNGPFKWTVGAFYKDLDSKYSLVSDGVPTVPVQIWEGISQYITGGALTIDQGFFTGGKASNKQLAAFGEVSYDFTDHWQVIAGGRIFDEKRKSTTSYGGVFPLLTGGPPPGTSDSKGDSTIFNPRLSVRYTFSDSAMAYFTYSRGFRSGGQNDLFALVPGGTQDFQPEKLTNYELGAKTAWLEGRMVLNAAAFYLDWKDLQAVTAEGPGGVGETIGNIGSASSKGIDAELHVLPVDGLDLSLAATLLKAETDETVYVPDSSGGSSIAVPKGTRIPRTAEHTLSVSGSYRFPITDSLNGFARASYAYVGDSIAALTRPDDKVPSHDTVDLRAGIEGGHWSAYVFAENLTNSKIYLMKESFPDPVTGQDQYYFGRPRTIGINVRVSY